MARKACVALMGLSMLGCDKKNDATTTAAASASVSMAAPSASTPETAAPAPTKERKYLFGHLNEMKHSDADFEYGELGIGGPPPIVRPSDSCPQDMVNVAGEFCVDRYETSLYDAAKGRRVSIFYHPNQRHTSERYFYWTHPEKTDAHAPLLNIPVPVPPAWELTEDFRIRAVSRSNVKPNGYMNYDRSKEACESAGKRLCKADEWVKACRGEESRDFPYGDHYIQDKCNVHRNVHAAEMLHGDATHFHTDPRLLAILQNGRPLLEQTGHRQACASKWGSDRIYDMVGNLDEWIDDPNGTFKGGFFSRGTTQGCQASISAHPASYYDYSLGSRCCLDLRK